MVRVRKLGGKRDGRYLLQTRGCLGVGRVVQNILVFSWIVFQVKQSRALNLPCPPFCSHFHVAVVFRADRVTAAEPGKNHFTMSCVSITKKRRETLALQVRWFVDAREIAQCGIDVDRLHEARRRAARFDALVAESSDDHRYSRGDVEVGVLAPEAVLAELEAALQLSSLDGGGGS